MSTQKFNASAKQPASRLDPPDTGESRGATYDEQPMMSNNAVLPSIKTR